MQDSCAPQDGARENVSGTKDFEASGFPMNVMNRNILSRQVGRDSLTDPVRDLLDQLVPIERPFAPQRSA